VLQVLEPQAQQELLASVQQLLVLAELRHLVQLEVHYLQERSQPEQLVQKHFRTPCCFCGSIQSKLDQLN
jgi:hypothetical protein